MFGEIVWNQNTIAVVMVFMVPIVAILAGIWGKIEQTRAECDLKRSMVERGMSAEDIERVMASKPSKK
jgi:hypothetical protein